MLSDKLNIFSLLIEYLRNQISAVSWFEKSLLLFGFIITSHYAWADASAVETVTFTEHIAPIIHNHCTSCHRPGQSAPFPLISYKDVRRRARTIASVVEDRYMPPWLPSGGDIKFKGERTLSEEEIDLIVSWVKNGSPKGDTSLLKPSPTFPDDKWTVGKPDLVLQMTEPYPLPAEGPDIYHQFVIPTNLKEEKWLKAIAFLPGSPSVVHHSLFYYDNNGRARLADEKDPAPGFRDMPLGDSFGKYIGGWVPGMSPMFLPEGLSTKLSPNGDIVLSTHFHLSGKPESEISTIGLYFDDKPSEKFGTQIQLPPHFGALKGIDIPAGAEETVVTDEFILPVPVKAFWVSCHAHYLGKSMRLVAELPDGNEIVLLNIPDWDFNWQEVYAFEDYVDLPAGTKLVSKVTWDNSADNPNNPSDPPVRVRWGKESFNEMAAIDLFVFSNIEKDIKDLEEAYQKHSAKPWVKDLFSKERVSFAETVVEKGMKKADLDQDGTLSKKEIDAVKEKLIKKSTTE